MFQIVSTCRGGGYLYCRTIPVHPKANSKGLYPLHRVLAEIKMGRALLDNEDVHHVNGDKTDNRPENLEVLSKSEHAKKHNIKLEDVVFICPNCKNPFFVKPHLARLREKRNKSGMVFCSRKCGGSV